MSGNEGNRDKTPAVSIHWGVIPSVAAFQAERQISVLTAASLAARSLASLEKTRDVGMTPTTGDADVQADLVL
jgi:hypothetical protein